MRFLSFEGLDGSGKSTLIARVRSELEKRGVRVCVTREPGGTPLAEEIRRLILRPTDSSPRASANSSADFSAASHLEAPEAATEILLYEASRAQHVAKVIRPALALGEWVLCDRYSESTVAFQCFARGLDRTEVDRLNRFAEQGLRPELVVLLDLTVEASRARQSRRELEASAESAAAGAPIKAGFDASRPHPSLPDRIEQEADEFHERVRQGFLTQAKEEPDRWVVLNAELSADDLFRRTILELERRGLLKATSK